jgi:hypothetical protein
VPTNPRVRALYGQVQMRHTSVSLWRRVISGLLSSERPVSSAMLRRMDARLTKHGEGCFRDENNASRHRNVFIRKTDDVNEKGLSAEKLENTASVWCPARARRLRIGT